MEALSHVLVDACHMLADQGQGDLIWGHVSARLPGQPDRILMKPAGFGLEEIDEDGLITVNLDGEKIAGPHPLHVEVFIHTEIMRGRPEVHSVVHTHPPHAVAFSSLKRPLLPVGHEGALFCDGLPVFDKTSDLIVSAELGRSVARTLGAANAMLMRNHGLVTAGRSVEEACMTAVLLDKACRVQLLAEAAGGPKVTSPLAEARAKRDRLYVPSSLGLAFRYCARRARSAGRDRAAAQAGWRKI